MAKIRVFTDGGSRGNPGPSALGVYIESDEGELAKIGKRIGIATNNIAEYSAIIEGFNWLIKNKEKLNIEEAHFYMDSLLARSQISGLYKVKNEVIRNFIFEIRTKEVELGVPVYYSHIPREENQLADSMVNQALDNKL
jgi:ribonuclease HI